MIDLANPEHIAISRSKGVKIDWKDGHTSEYGLTYLRDKCPCASCTGAHGTPPREPSSASPFQMFKPALTMIGAEQAGAEDALGGTGGQLRHPHLLERRAQHGDLLLGALAGHLPLPAVHRTGRLSFSLRVYPH